MADKEIKKIEERITSTTPSVIHSNDLLSSGYSQLNLACSGRTIGAIAKGQYVLMPGDSSAGKTWVGLSFLAEAAINRHFKDYRLIHDNAENGAWMDIAKYFGTTLEEKIEPPAGTKENPTYSQWVEEFYYRLDDLFKDGRPFIYLLDSENALRCEKDQELFNKAKNAYEKDKETPESYGTEKAKIHSKYLGEVVNVKLRESKSILIILSQSRANIGFGSMLKPKIRSGGTALSFYAHMEMWFSIKGDIKKKIGNKERSQGIYAKIKIEKNRITGQKRSVIMPIYHSYGIDEIGGNIDYLLEEGTWTKSRGSIHWKIGEESGNSSMEEIIKIVEENHLEKALRKEVSATWHEIEDQLRIERKKRYE
jgi:hypothetical protein